MLRMSIVNSSAAWHQDDGALVEEVLSGVTDTGVPRIREVLTLLSRVLNPPNDDEAAVALEPCDPVLTDAMRCILSHRWLVPSIHKTNAQGASVQTFFTQPFREGQVLSLYSSSKTYAALLREANRVGVRLLPVPFTFGQVMMTHVPNLSREAMKRRQVPESHALCAISFDSHTQLEQAPDSSQDPSDTVVMFSDSEFELLQSFCHCYALAGQVLQLQADLASDPGSVSPKRWDEVLCCQSLHAVMAGNAVFASEDGMLLFCYPGDASKALAHHRRKGTLGLESGKIVPVDPDDALQMIRWNAGEGKSVVISATVMESDGELQLHGLSISPQVFHDLVEPALSSPEVY